MACRSAMTPFGVWFVGSSTTNCPRRSYGWRSRLAARRDLHPYERLGQLVVLEPTNQTPNGVIADRHAMLLLESSPNGGQLHALTAIGQDLRLVGSDARGLLRWQPQRHGRVQPRLQLADAEERSVQKVLIGGPAAVAADGAAIKADEHSDLPITGAVAHQ